MNFNQWVNKWWTVLPPEARDEFQAIMTPHAVTIDPDGKATESGVQADVILEASRRGVPLWRNNNGAMKIENRMVRFGLGNTSKRVNEGWKSSDAIGIRPTLIEQQHIGRTMGVFLAVEAKEPGWKLTPGDEHGQAQNNFIQSVRTFGGVAGFASSVTDLERILNDV